MWTLGVPLPERLQELHAAVLGDTAIFVAGGYDSTSSASASAYRFSLATNSWHPMADLPAQRHHMMLAATSDSVYAVGGYDQAGAATATLWVYRADSNVWSPRAPLPQPRGAGVAAGYQGRLYVAGGLAGPGAGVDSADRYNPATNSWTRHPPMPTRRDHLGGGMVVSGALGAFLVTAGGRYPSPLTTTEAWSLLTNSWIGRAPLPAPRGGVGATVSPEGLHVLGGEDSIARGSHYLFDIASNTWTVLEEMPTPRHGMAVAYTGGRIYVIGGGIVPGLGPSNRVEIYQLALPGCAG